MNEQEFFAAATDILNKHVESGSVEYLIDDMADLFEEWEEDNE